MRPDKAKVVDEVWDDERIASFLDKGSMGDESQAYSQLLHAYRSMRIDDFRKFVELFKAAGGDTQARNGKGQTLAEEIANHAKSGPFIECLG